MAKREVNMSSQRIELRDERVLRGIFKKYFSRAKAFAIRFLRDEMLAADMVQESFLYMWQKAPVLNDERAFKVYLYHVVKNKCLNYIRDHRVELETCDLQESMEDETRVDEWVIENELKARLLEEINRLPDVRRDIMLLRLEGNSYEEISRELHLNINTLKTYKKQAYRELRERLADVGRLLVFVLLFFVIF